MNLMWSVRVIWFKTTENSPLHGKSSLHGSPLYGSPSSQLDATIFTLQAHKPSSNLHDFGNLHLDAACVLHNWANSPSRCQDFISLINWMQQSLHNRPLINSQWTVLSTVNLMISFTLLLITLRLELLLITFTVTSGVLSGRSCHPHISITVS